MITESPISDSRDFKSARRQRQNFVDLTKIDRLPPHSIENEQGALGCMLLDPNEAIPKCAARCSPEAFYDLRHQTLVTLLFEMADDRTPIDLITVSQRLRDRQQLEAVGGLAYLSALQDATPSALNLGYYTDVVVEKFNLRRVIAVCTEAVALVYESPEGAAKSVIDTVETEILKLSTDRRETELVPIRELIRGAIDRIQEFHSRQGATFGIPTGFVDYDKITGGLMNGEMSVIAARPSMGKTALAMTIAEYIGSQVGIPVGVFSLEMTKDSLAMRLLLSSARVNSRAVQDGFMSEGDFRKLTTASSVLSKSRIHIDDTSGLSVMQLRSRARRMYAQQGCRVFVIDYLQLLRSTSKKAEGSREIEVSEISKGVKALAKELSVPIIVLCQLNRDIEKDKKRKPRLSDLRESGSIEQDADVVGLMYTPATDDDEPERTEGNAVPVNLLIAKQRNGPTGEVNLTFLKSYTRFESASRNLP